MIDYQEIVSNPNSMFKITLVNNDINNWLVEFDGPSDTYYEGLHFRLSVTFSVFLSFSDVLSYRINILLNALTFNSLVKYIILMSGVLVKFA